MAFIVSRLPQPTHQHKLGTPLLSRLPWLLHDGFSWLMLEEVPVFDAWKAPDLGFLYLRRRISGLAVDLSFSCHPRHRSCGFSRGFFPSQKMVKMVRHHSLGKILEAASPIQKDRPKRSKNGTWMYLDVPGPVSHEKKSSRLTGYTQEWWQTTHCFPDFYYDQQFGWCGLCQFHIFSCYPPSLMDKNH